MSKTFVREGTRMPYTNSSESTIASGTPVLVGIRLGIAVADIEAGKSGYLEMVGVHKIPMAAVSPDQGAKAYWDDDNSVITSVATGHTLIGYFDQAADSGDATALVAINTMNA